MITSSHNPKIKMIRQLQDSSRERKLECAFVIEGVRLAEEALASRWHTRLVLYTQELNERGKAVLAGFSETGAEIEEVSPSVMRQVSDTDTPQGLLAVLELRFLPLPESLNFLLIPDSLRDPGNLGTIFRCAAAAGVQAIGVPPGSVDAFSPKVVRSAMGAHFHLPIHFLEWEAITSLVKQHRLKVFLAAAREGPAYFDADLTQPFALIIGGEAAGAGEQARRLANSRLHIPMPGTAESLNAASAAAVLLFEVVRQRNNMSKIEML